MADIFGKHPGDRYVMTHGNGPQMGKPYFINPEIEELKKLVAGNNLA